MSKMIERVAKALAWDHHRTEDNWQEWREAARATIEAMREPTGEMHEVGLNFNFGNYASEAWRAMIDAALSEKP